MISAKVIADSLCPRGNRLTTLEVVMPRYILAEFNTHRMKTRNSASSRAIPLRKMILSVLNNTFIPYAWQKDHKGMQGTEYLDSNKKYSFLDFAVEARQFLISEKDSEEDQNQLEELYTIISNKYDNQLKTLEEWWLVARDNAVEIAVMLNIFGLTKQLANRLLEPFMWHKVLVSATEWDNFFNLRCPQYQSGYKIGSPEEDKYESYKSWKDLVKSFFDRGANRDVVDHIENKSILEKLQNNKGQADIHMMFLAEAIYDAINESTPIKLYEGEWHIPYKDQLNINWLKTYVIDNSLLDNQQQVLEETVRKISVARCARLSYQTLGDNPEINYEKDLELYDTLAKSGHYSPFEHVARVMTKDEYNSNIKGTFKLLDMKGSSIDEIISLLDIKDLGWCLNYKGFIQERYLLEQNFK